jgi:hypothetical protein
VGQDFTLRGVDGEAVLHIARAPYPEDYEQINVRIEGDGLSCHRDVLTLRGDDLDAFFDGLANDWQGWSGTRRWDALEHGMTIEATHNGRRVVLLITLRRDYEADAWQVRVPLAIPPGEPLSEAAAAMRRLWE